MNKAYTRINFQDTPSTATPLNAANMNKIDKAISDIDDRVIELAGYQEEAEEAAEQASSSASAAAKAAETATADAEARVNAIIEGLEVYTKEESHKKFASVIKQTASGSPVLITDGAGANVLDFKGKGRSTQEQGNFYDGELLQGAYNTTNGNYGGATNYVCNKNMIPCKPNDTVSIAYEEVATYIFTLFYDSNGNFVSQLTSSNVNKANVTIPTNVRYVNFTIYKVGITPANAKKITVSVNGSTSYPSPDYPQEIESVGDSGWFDGELLQGNYKGDTGVYQNTSNYVCNQNSMPCKPNDIVKLTSEDVFEQITIYFYDKNMNFLNLSYNTGSLTEFSATAQENACYFNFAVNKANVTPQNAKPITVTINGKYALIVKSKGKNLLKNTATSQTNNGITFTPVYDDNGSLLYINANGTADSNAHGVLTLNTNISIKKGTYILSGCPSGGSATTYYVQAFGTNNYNTGSAILDIGNGYTATFADDDILTRIIIVVYKGTTVNNLKFYPMISATDSTYEPYKETVSYIPLNEPLRSIGNVTDEIDLERGVKISKIKETTVKITRIVTMSNGNVAGLVENVSDKYYGKAGAYCSKCVYDNNINPSFSSNTFYENPVNFVIVGNPNDTFESLKERYDGALLYYVLAEPITETIEPVDIATYNSVTYITATDNADMEVTYATDTKRYIDNKFAELQAAILATGANV